MFLLFDEFYYLSDNYCFPCNTARGTIISSIDMPPCWNESLKYVA